MSLDTRSRILNEALILFSERGFHESSVADIATAADVSEAAVFRVMGSKRELFREVVSAASTWEQVDLGDLMLRVFMVDIRTDLKAFIHECFKIYFDNIHIVRMSIAGRMQFEELRDGGVFQIPPLRAYLEYYLGEMEARGLVEVPNRPLCVDVLMGSVFSDVLHTTVTAKHEMFSESLSAQLGELWGVRIDAFVDEFIRVVKPASSDPSTTPGPRSLKVGGN